MANGTVTMREPLSSVSEQETRGHVNQYYGMVRIVTIVFTVFLLVTGIILLALGIFVTTIQTNYDPISGHIHTPAVLVAVAGVVVLLTGLLGIVGAVRVISRVLKVFLCVLVLLFFFQVICGIIVFIHREKAVDMATKYVSFTVSSYGQDSDVTRRVNYIQQQLHCCGLNDYQDWQYNIRYTCNRRLAKVCGVPASCCQPFHKYELEDNCGVGMRTNRTMTEASRFIYTTGCKPAFINWINNHLDAMGGAVLGFAIPQIFGLVCVYWMISMVSEKRTMYTYKSQVSREET
ncbi:tetraspanin-33-like [Lineus longissimus]|uniref:tetraspanin-33-like n=1 Tax=Lineus longissimus TaxID=88925 RepID=UPI002B4EEE83